jgi:hypothetical protein
MTFKKRSQLFPNEDRLSALHLPNFLHFCNFPGIARPLPLLAANQANI